MVGQFGRLLSAALTLPVLFCGFSGPLTADPVPRSSTPAGLVIARKSGEEVRFIDVSSWRFVDLRQDLLPGDVLRTNATGQLAVLFSDRTQIRVGRNTSLLVREMQPGKDAVLDLQAGTIWARAERGGPGVMVHTPAAAAAIRGTDWTMTVAGSKTSLTVLEGEVELSNSKGSVRVAQGEAAVANIGQAPRKIVIVDSDDREQMLFYLAPRAAFNYMPASPLPMAEMRRQADRIAALPEDRRGTGDLLVLAETQLTLEGREQAKLTLAKLRQRSLTAAETARVELVEAIMAAAEKRYGDAVKLFNRASTKLDGKRRAIARYGRYYAASLADPNHSERPPQQMGGPHGALLQAYSAGFLKDIRAAINVLLDAERQYPDDASLPAYRAQFALLLNDRKQVVQAYERALTLNPSEPTALEARANYKSGILSDLDGALTDLQTAARITPGSTSIWNAIGNLQSERGDLRAAEAAFHKSIALDPQDPVVHANLAIFYLDQSRMPEAKAEIEKALAADPGFDVALVARGRYNMQAGKLDEAVDDILAGTVANPGYAQGQVLLSAAQYEKGDRIAAAQALDNAARLDDNDPVIFAMRAAMDINDHNSQGAIRNAQAFLSRARARGGQYGSLSANSAAGSTLNNAFRLQGLDAWGVYYGDAVFDPFAGGSYIDQMLRGSASPFANNYDYDGNAITFTQNSLSSSSAIQGLLLEPGMLAGSERSANLFNKPFMQTSLGAGATVANGKVGRLAQADVQGFSNTPFPLSYTLNGAWQVTPDQRSTLGGLFDLESEKKLVSGSAFVTASPTPYDRVVSYYDRNDSRFSLDTTLLGLPIGISATNIATNAGVGISHTLGYRDVVNAAVFYTDIKSDSLDTISIPFGSIKSTSTQKTWVAAASRSVGDGDLTWRYGVEAGKFSNFTQIFLLGDPLVADPSEEASYGRAYLDLRHEMTPDLIAEYGLAGIYLNGDTFHVERLEPRLGLAWSPASGQWLRAAYSRQSLNVNTPTLSPVDIVGLQPNDVGTSLGGYVDTFAMRWDAEWTEDFFTSAEFQHQDISKPSISVPLNAIPFTAAQGRIDRGSLTANLLLGHGFGLSSTLAYAQSENRDPASATFRRPLPYVPDWAGQVALTWVNEANVKASLAANYIGERKGVTGNNLKDYWTLDAKLTWEPFDKRMALELAGYNLLDRKFKIDKNMPGWGRSFWGMLKVRF